MSYDQGSTNTQDCIEIVFRDCVAASMTDDRDCYVVCGRNNHRNHDHDLGRDNDPDRRHGDAKSAGWTSSDRFHSVTLCPYRLRALEYEHVV